MVPKALGLILAHPASICLSADLPICRMLEKSCFPGVGKGRPDAILTGRMALLTFRLLLSPTAGAGLQALYLPRPAPNARVPELPNSRIAELPNSRMV
ncbi:hypothetical protein HRbin11_00262 [bacterium HR11]|nr:hypothetical protein HRbin11_00262 [bacterium HR11]